ncbi:MAG: CDP-alcohol phosphatidyltransferase family protein [Planctomycetes bacterium]|nr:CDP-alcohol phosphatidyltransferase family protein [Planctomycetota bacterium]
MPKCFPYRTFLAMIGKKIGKGFSIARDFIARGLVKIGISPNILTLTGMVLTLAAGLCLAIGAGKHFAWNLDPQSDSNAFLLLAAVLLTLSSACDMLDGAVARIGNKKSAFGAFLDSTLDRYSDFAIFAGIGIFYATRTPANITFTLLSMIAMINAMMISYCRARAENIIESCKVGYWQRGERSTAILVGTFAYNIPALLLQQSLLTTFTVLRRIFYTRNVIRWIENGKPIDKKAITDPREGNFWLKIRLWRWERGTVPYDVITTINLLWLLLARIPATDLLRQWFLK